MKSELIADFANHADFYVGNEHSDKSYEEKQRLWTEKLVELVVRECMDVVSKKCASPTAYEALTEHFGVEE